MTVSATAVRKLLRRHRLGPAPRTRGPSWSEFLKAQAAGTLSCDFFHIDTISLRRVYALFFIAIDRRIVYLAGVTAHPVGPWATQQARDLVANLEDRGGPFRSLVRDRDAKFVGPFDEVVTSVGARVIKTPFRSPTAKPFAERFVLTARSECLDWVLVRSERHAERLLHEFVAHCNQERPHRGIGLEQPVPKLALHQFDSGDDVERVDRLGGLLHEYRLAA